MIFLSFKHFSFLKMIYFIVAFQMQSEIIKTNKIFKRQTNNY